MTYGTAAPGAPAPAARVGRTSPAPAPPRTGAPRPAWLCKWDRIAVAGRQAAARWRVRRLRRGRFGMRAAPAPRVR